MSSPRPRFLACAALTLLACTGLPADAQTPANPDPGQAMLRSRFGWGITPGWSMMSESERQSFRRQLDGARTVGECSRLMAQQRARMEERARQQHMPLPRRGEESAACEGLSP